MNIIQQCKKWVKEHPKATLEETWMAGYFQSTSNWCKKTR